MDQTLACEAISTGCCLELQYDGFVRVVEIHAVGISKKGTAIMRVWQVRGGSASGGNSGWKLLNLDEIIGARILDEPSEAPQSGYKPDDSAMIQIICQL